MDFFDGNCMIGTSGRRPFQGPSGVDEILAALSRCGVRRVLAYHSLAREWDPTRGNEVLADLLLLHPNLEGCWVADPAAVVDSVDAESMTQQAIGAGFRAMRIFPDPGDHHFSLSGRPMELLAACCAERRLPVIIDSQQPDWNALSPLLSRHSGLAVILTGLGYRWGRDLYPLLAEHSNLYVEISTLTTHGALEDITERFGASHLIFGTNAPVFAPGGSVVRVELSDLVESDRESIASTTLRRLTDVILQ